MSMLNRKIAITICASTLGLAISSTASFATAKEAVVTASALNVRSGASISYSVITKVYKGDKVEILESSNGWHKIKTSTGKIGWSSAQYLSTSTTSGTTSTTGKKATVTVSALNVRSGANTSYSVITKVYKGETVEILESSNGWHKIKTSTGKIGWSSAQYLSTSTTSGTTSTTGKKATVTVSALNVRSGANTSYSVITKVYKGETVEILESSNGWHKIKTSTGKIGWSSAQYLSTSTSTVDLTTSSSKAKEVVALAHTKLGKPYVWGSEGPNSFDCSGLMTYIFKNGAGINLPRTSKQQSNFGTTVSKSNLQPGDLIFSSTNGSGGVSHVGVYVGNGEMIHSPKPGDVVQKSKINTSYWNKAYLWAKRVI